MPIITVRQKTALGLWGLTACLLVFLLSIRISQSQRDVHFSQVKGMLGQISLGLSNYHDVYQTSLLQFSHDSNISWRQLWLKSPGLDQEQNQDLTSPGLVSAPTPLWFTRPSPPKFLWTRPPSPPNDSTPFRAFSISHTRDGNIVREQIVAYTPDQAVSWQQTDEMPELNIQQFLNNGGFPHVASESGKVLDLNQLVAP